MSEQIAELLAAHEAWGGGWYCSCDESFLGSHEQHVADAIAAHIGTVLDELREDAAQAMAAPIRERIRANGYTFEVEAETYRDQSDAVLGVVRAAMGLEAASQPAQGANGAAGEDDCQHEAGDEGEARP